MLVIGTFEHSYELELALDAVEKIGVDSNRILAVGMDSEYDEDAESVRRESDGIEVGFACGTAFAVIGVSVGFRLTWGPVVWGLIAAFVGFAIGFAGRTLILKKGALPRRKQKPWPEVTVIVECAEDHSPEIRKIMRKHGALTIGQWER